MISYMGHMYIHIDRYVHNSWIFLEGWRWATWYLCMINIQHVNYINYTVYTRYFFWYNFTGILLAWSTDKPVMFGGVISHHSQTAHETIQIIQSNVQVMMVMGRSPISTGNLNDSVWNSAKTHGLGLGDWGSWDPSVMISSGVSTW